MEKAENTHYQEGRSDASAQYARNQHSKQMLETYIKNVERSLLKTKMLIVLAILVAIVSLCHLFSTFTETWNLPSSVLPILTLLLVFFTVQNQKHHQRLQKEGLNLQQLREGADEVGK
ncbi:hypothetical protein ACT3UJ_06645 [Halomonas sp. 86]|uniref:hypothetical protein n=1 Tax=unclassified Halomonas TaxID=2609666 RepID=UPI004033DDB8